ncbi:hypothetical protein [Psychroserpens sp. SPM9]|uniref:hypothetical protein n=1 Tax=Psychroserpens sp. SPM9 TaxID=2975598 RepID=UPI0021A3B021|nr:hypothetical protein [Psychroserpens sp. SPM9]MDG5490157.1 hypothetical protein [Psychroserpens sp. SPM9]
MKKIVLFLLLIVVISYDCSSQSLTKSQLRGEDSWVLSVGVNAIGSLGTRNPVKDLGDFQFKRPFALAIQHRWSRIFSIEQDFTMNRFTENTIIDGNPVPEDYNYYSTNTYLKYYISDDLFRTATWFDVFVGGGLGVFTIDEFNTSANAVIGGTFWVNQDIGIRLQGVGKFAFNHKDNLFDNNHLQYMIQGVFRF